jgi:NAD(P)-dependent dehydrogenase (short-subunit alcohol dehydrogenase family)
MSRVLVTGSNRGIGLEFCRRYAERGDEVLAACRRASGALDSLAGNGVQVIPDVDVSTDACVPALEAALGGKPVDLLINNAGILRRDPGGKPDLDNIRTHFEVNTFGPLRVTLGLASLLAPGAKVAIITSLMGSIDDNGSGGSYAYRLSKAAVNMTGVNLAHDLRPRGIPVVLLHPGMVATEMTGGRGIAVEESVAGLMKRLDALDMSESGSFWHSDGRRLAW